MKGRQVLKRENSLHLPKLMLKISGYSAGYQPEEDIKMVNLQIKTPIWTGGIDMKSDLLQSSGIMGSLRWWMEALVRGMGKYSCDPTDGSQRCPKGDEKQKYYCYTCLIFGATGMRRLFRLEMTGGERVFNGGPINIKPLGRSRGWYLGGGIKGKVKLLFINVHSDFDRSLLLAPLIIASNWGGLGAKTQHGYGVVELKDCPKVDVEKFKNGLEEILERLSKFNNIKLREGSSEGLPNLREMLFAKIQFEGEEDWWREVDGFREICDDERMKSWVKSGSVPITPAIRNWLRYGDGARLWRAEEGGYIENWLFGTTGNNKKASKINISCAYNVEGNLWEFRVWGWIPENDVPSGFDRNKFLDGLKEMLSRDSPWEQLLGKKTGNYNLKVWREFKSARDTVEPSVENFDHYLKSLLQGEEIKNDA